jgi:arginine decarboxylase
MEMQVDHTLEIEAIEKALQEHPKAKGVMVLSPTYYGAAADLRAIAELVHNYDKPLLVDEAWGPHLHFHPDLPFSAMEAGADFCINSTHKLISGLSQASMVHIKGKRMDQGRVQGVLRICLSTSPNSLLLASLDVARMQMATQGKELLTHTLKIANWAREQIKQISGMWAYGAELIGQPGIPDYDLTRLVFTGKNLGFTGYQLEKWLRFEHKIQIEMSDLLNVVALVTIGNTQEDLEKLVTALNEIARDKAGKGDMARLNAMLIERTRIEMPDWPPQRLTPREAFFSPFEVIPFKKSAGRICTEVVTPYPPGIPILCPGEEITKEIINHMQIELQAGIHIQGPVDRNLNTIHVVKE